MDEIHKPRVSLSTIRLEHWIIILTYVSMFILIILISWNVKKLILLVVLPSYALLVLYAVHNPKRAFWVCFFILPFIYYNWGIGISPSLPNMALQRFLFFIVWLTYLLHRRENRNERELTLNVMDMLLIFLFVWLGISMFIANPIQGAYYGWPSRGITIFLLFLVGKEMIKTSDDLWTVVTIFAAQGLVMGAIGIIEAFTQFNLWDLLSPYLTPAWKPTRVGYHHHSQMLLGEILRIKGPMGHAVAYGQYLAFLLPFCIGIMWRKRIFGMVAFSLALLAMIFTQSRSSYIAAIVSFMLFLFFARRIVAIKVLGVVILTGAIIAFFFSPYMIDLYENRILATVRSDGRFHEGMLIRVESPVIILKSTIKESPLFGFGHQSGDKVFHYAWAKGAIDETAFAVIGALENGIPYALGVEIYFGGIMIFMVYQLMFYRKGKIANKYNLSLIFFTAFTAGMVNLHIQQLGESLSNIIIVFAGIQSVYYHERYVMKNRDNRQVVNVRR